MYSDLEDDLRQQKQKYSCSSILPCSVMGRVFPRISNSRCIITSKPDWPGVIKLHFWKEEYSVSVLKLFKRLQLAIYVSPVGLKDEGNEKMRYST